MCDVVGGLVPKACGPLLHSSGTSEEGSVLQTFPDRMPGLRGDLDCFGALIANVFKNSVAPSISVSCHVEMDDRAEETWPEAWWQTLAKELLQSFRLSASAAGTVGELRQLRMKQVYGAA